MLTALLSRQKHEIFNTFAQYPSNAYVRQTHQLIWVCVFRDSLSLHSNIFILLHKHWPNENTYLTLITTTEVITIMFVGALVLTHRFSSRHLLQMWKVFPCVKTPFDWLNSTEHMRVNEEHAYGQRLLVDTNRRGLPP